MFENKDKDLDGRLSFEEFMGEKTRAERLFQLMDKDGDGYVTKHVRIIVFSYLYPQSIYSIYAYEAVKVNSLELMKGTFSSLHISICKPICHTTELRLRLRFYASNKLETSKK